MQNGRLWLAAILGAAAITAGISGAPTASADCDPGEVCTGDNPAPCSGADQVCTSTTDQVTDPEPDHSFDSSPSDQPSDDALDDPANSYGQGNAGGEFAIPGGHGAIG